MYVYIYKSNIYEFHIYLNIYEYVNIFTYLRIYIYIYQIPKCHCIWFVVKKKPSVTCATFLDMEIYINKQKLLKLSKSYMRQKFKYQVNDNWKIV